MNKNLLKSSACLMAIIGSLILGPTMASAETYNLALKKGLNFVSIPVAPSTPEIASVISPIQYYVNNIIEYTASDSADPWKRYHPGLDDYNDLTVMHEAKGYWIEIRYDRTLSVSGTNPTGNYVLNLKPGWNAIGWPYTTSRDIKQALATLAFGSDYTQVARFNPTTQSQEDFLDLPASDAFTDFEPGYGYYIYMLGEKTVTLTPEISYPQTPMLNEALPGDGQIELHWTDSQYATAYDIQYGTSSGVYDQTINLGSVTNYTVTGLTNGVLYYFIVVAKNSAGTSANSNELSSAPAQPNAPPSVDAGQDQTINLPAAAELSATISDDGLPSGTLNILWSKDSGPGNVTFDDPASAQTSATFSTDGVYVLKVTADDTALSNEDTVTITVGLTAPVLNSAVSGDEQVVLNWNSVEGAVGYHIKYGTSSGTYTSTIDAGNVTSYTVTGLTNETPYYFAITAYGAATESLVSNELNATPLGGTLISGGIYNSNMTWTKEGSPYKIDGFCLINGYVTLTIEPGVEVIFLGNYRLQFYGGLIAQGTEEEPIKFRSVNASPSAGDWKGLQLTGTTRESVIDHVEIRHANKALEVGKDVPRIANSIIENNNIGLYVTGGAETIVENNTIQNNIQYGIYMANTGNLIDIQAQNNSILNNAINCSVENSAYNIDMKNNWWGTTDVTQITDSITDFLDNSNYPAIDFSGFLDGPNGSPVNTNKYVYGRLENDTTWAQGQGPFVALGDLIIPDGLNLTIEPDVAVEFDGNHKIEATGSITAQGSSDNPILFTSAKASPAPGDWQGIVLKNAGSLFDHVTIEYADQGISVPYSAEESPTIQNSILQKNNKGISFELDTSPEIQFNTISDNDYGIFYTSCNVIACRDTEAIIQYNKFYNNSASNFFTESTTGNSSSQRINAKNNWWGSADPQEIITMIHDFLDDNILPAVDFAPFMDGPEGSPDNSWNNRLYANLSGTTIASSLIPYIVIGNIFVESGNLLTIEPGTELRFDGNYKLDLKGSLNAQGTSENKIVFTSNQLSPAAGDWEGLVFDGSGSSSSTLYNTQINYAQKGAYLSSASPDISYSAFQNNIAGLWVYRASNPQIDHNVITHNTESGIAIQHYYSTLPNPAINYNSMHDNGLYNVSIHVGGASSNLSTSVINAENNWWGYDNAEDISTTIYDYYDGKIYFPKVDFSPFLLDEPGYVVNVTDNSVTNRFLNKHYSETAQINYTIDIDADVTIKIYDNTTGALVRTLLNSQAQLAGSHSESWDGTDDSAQPLPVGVYFYTINAQTSDGKRGQYDPIDFSVDDPVLSNATITPANSLSPFKGERLDVSYDLDTPALVTLSGYRQEGYEYTKFVDEEPKDEGGNIDYWDGRNTSGDIIVSDYPVYIQSKTEKLPISFIVIEDKSTLDITELISDPYVIRPLYNEVTTITYSINEAADVSVKILSPDGVSVLDVLEQDVSKSAGEYSLIWDGRTSAGKTIAEEGDYRIHVEAVDALGKTVTRDGNIRVLF